MKDPPPSLPDHELRRQRQDIRRGLTRVNWAVLAIVAVVITLALAGVFAAYRASRNADAARGATQQAREELWQSYLPRAKAGRLSGVMGRKQAGEELLAAAARTRPSFELRNEAIAHLALTDLQDDGHYVDFPTNFTAVDFDAELSRYAMGTQQGAFGVYDVADNQSLFQCPATNGPLKVLVLSLGGGYAAAAYATGNLFVFSTTNGICKFSRQVPLAWDFSPDDSLLALLTAENKILFFNTASGQECLSPLVLSNRASDISFAPGGETIGVVLGGAVEIWDCRKREKRETFEHNVPVTALAWSRRQLAVGDATGDLEVWDLPDHKSHRWSAHKDVVSKLVFNHRGDVLVSVSYDSLCCLWNPQTRNLRAATTRGFGVAFSRDDTRLAYETGFSTGAGWGRWQVARPAAFRCLNCANGSDKNIFQADFSPDGRSLAVIKNDGLQLFDLASDERWGFRPLRRARAAYFLADGKSLLTCGDDRLSIWPLLAGGRHPQLGQPKQITLPKGVHVDCARLSADSQQVGMALTDSKAALVALDRPEKIILFQGASNPNLPALSPDGRWLVTGTFHGGGSIVWNAANGQKLLDLDQGNANAFFSPDGRVLLLGGDKQYRAFETASWKLMHALPTEGANDLPNYAAFSPDGRLLSIVKEHRRVEIIDAHSWTPLATLTPPDTEVITGLTFSRDNALLAVSTAADLVQIWDLRLLRHELAVLGLDWRDDGSQPQELSLVSVTGPSSSSQYLTLAVGGVAFVIFCAWFVLARQQRLFHTYLELDRMNEQRNQELRAAQAVSLHSQKMEALGTLAAGIAHDFNNLLSVIRMSNKLVGREVRGQPELEENVAEIEKAVHQGKTVVRSMLGYSRSDSSNNGRVCVPELVENIVSLLSKQFLGGLVLNLQLDRDTPLVQTPQARLEQILLNLIVNAAEAMDGKGDLRIEVRPRENPGQDLVRLPRAAKMYVELVVADAGPGIGPDILPRIFEPFFTTKLRGTTRGTGLGLSMVYTMAEQDKLGVGVSTTIGHGTAFRILIPVDDADQPLSPAGALRQQTAPVVA